VSGVLKISLSRGLLRWVVPLPFVLRVEAREHEDGVVRQRGEVPYVLNQVLPQPMPLLPLLLLLLLLLHLLLLLLLLLVVLVVLSLVVPPPPCPSCLPAFAPGPSASCMLLPELCSPDAVGSALVVLGKGEPTGEGTAPPCTLLACILPYPCP